MIVSVSAVVEALIATEHVPTPAPDEAVTQLDPPGKLTSPLVPNCTDAPPTKFPFTSFTVAKADDPEPPSAGTEDGLNPKLTAATGPATRVRVALPEPVSGDEPEAETVTRPAVVPALTEIEHVPDVVVVQVLPAGKLT